jgi:hypothetical protein
MRSRIPCGDLYQRESSITRLAIVFSALALASFFAPGATAGGVGPPVTQCPVADTCTTYNITFQPPDTGSIAPAAGSFIYDSSSNTFYDFDVSWDGITFDLTPAANNPQIDSFTSGPCASDTGGVLGFAIMSESCGSPAYDSWTATTGTDVSTNFSFFDSADPTDSVIASVGVYGSGTTINASSSSTNNAWSIASAQGPAPGPPTSMPESGALIMLFANLAAVAFFARKRVALGFRQATRAAFQPPPSR